MSVGERLIPRAVVHVFRRGALPAPLVDNRAKLAAANPDWRFELFDEDAIVDYIRTHYGAGVLRDYLAIEPGYGAARADLFRYLRIHAEGGVYLDVKSTLTRPLDAVVAPDDDYILCQWANGPGEAKCGLGLHPDLAGVPGGEFQQWHVIARAGHPFLAAVIERVLANIRGYTPWRMGVGAAGVLRTTGPIAYTLAIAPILDSHPHRLSRDETTIGLQFSIGDGYVHRQHFPHHYSTLTSPVVRLAGTQRLGGMVYDAAARLRNAVRRR